MFLISGCGVSLSHLSLHDAICSCWVTDDSRGARQESRGVSDWGHTAQYILEIPEIARGQEKTMKKVYKMVTKYFLKLVSNSGPGSATAADWVKKVWSGPGPSWKVCGCVKSISATPPPRHRHRGILHKIRGGTATVQSNSQLRQLFWFHDCGLVIRMFPF